MENGEITLIPEMRLLKSLFNFKNYNSLKLKMEDEMNLQYDNIIDVLKEMMIAGGSNPLTDILKHLRPNLQ